MCPWLRGGSGGWAWMEKEKGALCLPYVHHFFKFSCINYAILLKKIFKQTILREAHKEHDFLKSHLLIITNIYQACAIMQELHAFNVNDLNNTVTLVKGFLKEYMG